MQNLIFALLAAFSGACLAVQQAVNANLRAGLGSIVWANFVSFFIGLAAILLTAIVLRAPIPSPGLAGRIPWWGWTGGLLGAVYVGLSILLVPRLGVAAFITLLIAGQMVAALALDHFGLFGLTQRPLDLSRALGLALVIGGVALMRR